MHYRRGLWLVAMLLFIAVSCSKKDNPVGIDLSDGGDSDTFPKTVEITPSSHDISIHTERVLGDGTNLLVGDYDGVQVRSLLRYRFSWIFEDTAFVDTFTVDQAVVRLVMHDVFPSSDEVIEHNLMLSPVDDGQYWSESVATWAVRDTAGTDTLFWDEPGGDFTSNPIAQKFVGTTADTNFVEVLFDVTEWVLTVPDDSLGLMLWANDERNMMRHFYSSESTVPPELIFYDYAEDDTAEVKFVAKEDTGLLNNENPETLNGDEEFLRVRNGYRERALFKFDMPDSLRKATINHVAFTLTIDPTRSEYINNDLSLSVYMVAEPIFSDSTDSDELTVDPDSVYIAAFSRYAPVPTEVIGDQEQITFEGYPLNYVVQDWLNDDFDNDGLLVRSAAENRDIEYISFYSREADPALAPRLIITYTQPIDFFDTSKSAPSEEVSR